MENKTPMKYIYMYINGFTYKVQVNSKPPECVQKGLHLTSANIIIGELIKSL